MERDTDCVIVLIMSPSCVFAVDLSISGLWSGGIEEHCEKMDEHHTPLSKQQLVQLIRSLILVEQVSILEIRWSIFLS